MRPHHLRAAAGGDSGEIVADPVMHWDFGDTNCWNRTSSTVTDLTGNGLNGTIINYNSSNETHSYNSNKGGYCEVAQTGTGLGGASGINGMSGYNGNFRGSRLFSKVGWTNMPSYNGSSTVPAIQPYTLEFIADMGHPWVAGSTTLINATIANTNYSSNKSGSYYSFAGVDWNGIKIRRSDLFLNNNRLFEYGFFIHDDVNLTTNINDTGLINATGGVSSATNFTYNMSTAGDTTGWEQIIVSRDPTGPEPGYGQTRMWRNGVRFAEKYSNIDYSGNYSLITPVEKWLIATGGWGVVRAYDKAFTDADALGQYNAQKGRFGI